MSPPYTNLYELTKCCYWFDCKIFNQSECRNSFHTKKGGS